VRGGRDAESGKVEGHKPSFAHFCATKSLPVLEIEVEREDFQMFISLTQ
jgi:hypothetical protein